MTKQPKGKKENKKVSVEKRIHGAYQDWLDSGKAFRKLVGKWQYIYSSPKGEISLVRLFNYLHEEDSFWEIYSLKGDLFEDVERFDTKKKAEKQIKEYLI